MKISTLITNLALVIGLSVATTMNANADPGAYGRPGMGDTSSQTMPMQKQMETMHRQMDAIHQTDDPKQHQRLLDEHWKSMGEMSSMMGMMMSMMMGGTQAGPMGKSPGSGGMGDGMQPGMMGGGMGSSQQRGGPMMQGEGKPSQAPMPSVEEMWKHQQDMQGWMSAMQGMMEQMLQHDQQRWRHHNHSN